MHYYAEDLTLLDEHKQPRAYMVLCLSSQLEQQCKSSVPCYVHTQFAPTVVTAPPIDEAYRCVPSILKTGNHHY